VFVTVRVPADTHGARLALSFRPPGTSLGLYLAAGGAALLVGLTTFDVILRRRRRTPGSSPVAGRTASSFARQESEDFGEVPALLRGLPEA
jgi:hypothetical protein